LNYVGHSIRNL